MVYKMVYLAVVMVLIGIRDGIGIKQTATALDFSDTINIREIIYTSEDKGKTWRPLDTNLPEETEVAFMEKRGKQIILATDNRGIFVSDERKGQWKQIGDGLPGTKITALHVSGDEIYTGVFQKGIYMSSDDGKSWRSLNGDLKDLRIRAILKVKEELMVATDIGIFKSSNGQSNWKQLFSECQVISLNQEGGKIIAGGVLGVLLSVDDGEHWNWIHQEGAAHNTAIIGGKVFVMNISSDLFRTEDWGRTWKKLSYQPHEGSYIYEMAKAGDYLLMSNNYGIHRSADWGRTWQLILETEEVIFFDFLVFDEIIYAGTRSWNEYRGKGK